MSGGVVYHWKHGWIPLDHVAALSKAKGNHALAAKYVAAIHEAKGIHTRQDVAKALLDVGSLNDSTHRAAAMAAINEAAHRLGAEDLLPGAGKKAGPADAAEAFRMGGPELRQHAAAGSTVAQTELDRRAAKHGKPSTTAAKAPTAVPAEQAKSLTPAELHAQNRGDLKVGDRVSLKAGGSTRVGTVTAFDTAGRAHIDVTGHGMVTRSAGDVSKDIHPATLAAHERSMVGDFRKTPTINLQSGLKGSFPESKKAAMRAELRRRGITPIDEAPSAATPKVTAPAVNPAKDAALARWESENRAAAPAGFTVQSRVSSTEAGGVFMGQHSLHAASNERVGSVLDRKNGRFLALYNGKQLGDGYATRHDAFAALAAKHEAVTAAERKKADAAARRQANAVPIGIFQPHTPQSDGTARGTAAAAKIKQSFKFNDHTVHIETAMSKDQTKAFLDDVHAVLLKSGHMDGPGITFHVPSGDAKFRQGRRGTVGGYVRQGQRTIFVNPKIANGDIADSFGGPASGDSFMSAAKQTNGRQYVITHELGHVLDNQHNHTRDASTFQALGRDFTSTSVRGDATSLHRDQRANLSTYGRTNVQEGYAEAYAQWIHGGPGSSPAADAFAAQYGWTAPKWYREGRRSA